MQNVLEGVGDSGSITTKKANGEPAFKKPRMETPSPLPTFKVNMTCLYQSFMHAWLTSP
jgi:hypothetical protein